MGGLGVSGGIMEGFCKIFWEVPGSSIHVGGLRSDIFNNLYRNTEGLRCNASRLYVLKY